MILGVLLAIPAGRDAATAWRLSELPDRRPSPQDNPLQRLRWMQRNLTYTEAIKANAAQIRLAARQLLSASPFHAIAMRYLGIVAGIADQGDGKKAFALAERITRRDLPTQIFLIDRSASDDDLKGTLAHYDRALLVYPESSAQLFPVLSQAVSDSDVRAAVIPYAGRYWFKRFLEAAEGLNADPLALVSLHRELQGKLAAPDLQPFAMHLLGSLIKQGRYADARELMKSIPALPASAPIEIGFSEATTDPRLAPLAWTLSNDDVVQAEVLGGNLIVTVARERSALVAERTTLFEPGRYTFVQHVQSEADAPPARLEWLVTCPAAKSSQVLKTAVAADAVTPVQQSGIEFGAGCEAQNWQLRVTSDLSQSAAAVRITSLTLTKD